MTKTQENISKRVKELREWRGWSQIELASRAGIDRKTVNRIENGHFMPSVETLVALGKAFDIPTDTLLGL
jgi:transcriptional regulator with XRE-family HTH domain